MPPILETSTAPAPKTTTADLYQVLLSFQFLRLYASPLTGADVIVGYYMDRREVPTLATLVQVGQRSRN